MGNKDGSLVQQNTHQFTIADGSDQDMPFLLVVEVLEEAVFSELDASFFL